MLVLGVTVLDWGVWFGYGGMIVAWRKREGECAARQGNVCGCSTEAHAGTDTDTLPGLDVLENVCWAEGVLGLDAMVE